jgi:hypothetical protein
MDILSADWSVHAKPSVVERKFDPSAAAKLFDEEGTEPEEQMKPEQIGDFQWLDVDKDGVYELLVTYAASRAFFGGPAIFKSVAGKKVRLQTLNGWMLRYLNDALKDLDGDGVPELLLPILLSEYRGARFMPVWTAVYKWNGEKFVDMSSQFSEFYHRDVLPEIEMQIQKASVPWQPPAAGTASPEDIELSHQSHDEELATAWVVRDKIMRVLGEEPRAGVERAYEWARSPNENIRADAMVVFEELEDPAFTAELQVLAVDPYPSVAHGARRVLERLKKKSR